MYGLYCIKYCLNVFEILNPTSSMEFEVLYKIKVVYNMEFEVLHQIKVVQNN